MNFLINEVFSSPRIFGKRKEKTKHKERMSPHETKNKQALICKDKRKKKLMGKVAHDK